MNEIKTNAVEEVEENSLVIKFAKPYVFEGKSYEELDLSNLENITGNDMIQVNKILERNGSLPILEEMKLEYAQEIAVRVTGLPIEFFRGLSMKNSMKLKNVVSNFMYGDE